MKVWRSYGSEHSMNLRVVGTFKTQKEAEEAFGAFERVVAVAQEDEENTKRYTEPMLAVLGEVGVNTFTTHDLGLLEYYWPIELNGNQITLDTDEIEVEALLKVLIEKGAKVEMYSRHHHPQG